MGREVGTADCWKRAATGGARRAGRIVPALALALVLAAAVGAAGGEVGARGQDAAEATPIGDGGAAECAPVDPAAFATPAPAATGAASPAASPDANGTPAASPSPATPAPSPTPDGAVLAAELNAVARALAACLSEGDAETTPRLATDAYLGVLAGEDGALSAADYAILAPELPVVPVAIRAVAATEADGRLRAAADVEYAVGNQLARGRWSFVREIAGDGTGDALTPWRVDAEEPLAVDAPDGAEAVRVGLEEYAIGAEPASVAGPDVVLNAINDGAEAHEVLVFRLDGGATTDDLLRQTGPALPAGITFAGQITVGAGDEAALVLVDLAPGDYALVCLLPDANGTPHLAFGMEAALTVEG